MKPSTVGISCLVLWVGVSAGARLLAHETLTQFSPFVVCFHIFLATQVFFLLLSGRKLWRKRKRLRARIGPIILLNVFAIGAWFGSLYPLKALPPSIVSSSVAACSPLFAWMIDRWRFGPRNQRGGGIAAVLFALGLLLLWRQCATFGCAGAAYWCLAASGSIAATAALTASLRWPAGESLAVRFWSLILFSGCGAALGGESLIPAHSSAVPLGLISIFYGVVPLYLVQLSMNRLQPLTVTMALPFIPLSVFLLETRRSGWDLYSADVKLVVSSIFVISVAAVLRKCWREAARTVRRSDAAQTAAALSHRRNQPLAKSL